MNPPRPRVFLIAPRSTQQLHNAGEFGDVVEVFPQDHRLRLHALNEELARALERLRAERFDPEVNYVCLIGPPPATAVFFLAFQAYQPQVKRVQLLVFVANENVYQVRDLYPYNPEERSNP